MIQLPDLRKDSKETQDILMLLGSEQNWIVTNVFLRELTLRCRPICKSRRREWNGTLQNTSAELLLERKPLPDCFRRCPKKVFPNSPCPLFARSHQVTVNERNKLREAKVVRICQAPIDDTVETPYLRYADMAKTLGAWGAVKANCAFCPCGSCCPCGVRAYMPQDETAARLQTSMREFDSRVKHDYMQMRIMYDIPQDWKNN